jgi:GNAT superfamily N-acetyltransferase
VHIVTRVDRPDLQDVAAEVFRERWPEFIFHDDVPKKYIGRVEEYFSRYDIMVLDEGAVVAGGWGVPLSWDGTVGDLPSGYDDAMVRAVEGREAGAAATTLSFMAAAVGSTHDKRGLATVVLEELTRRAHEDGLPNVIAWESWAAMAFPVTGDYVVPDALNLVRIDRERDRGSYVEENLWVQHS